MQSSIKPGKYTQMHGNILKRFDISWEQCLLARCSVCVCVSLKPPVLVLKVIKLSVVTHIPRIQASCVFSAKIWPRVQYQPWPVNYRSPMIWQWETMFWLCSVTSASGVYSMNSLSDVYSRTCWTCSQITSIMSALCIYSVCFVPGNLCIFVTLCRVRTQCLTTQICTRSPRFLSLYSVLDFYSVVSTKFVSFILSSETYVLGFYPWICLCTLYFTDTLPWLTHTSQISLIAWATNQRRFVWQPWHCSSNCYR